MAQYLSPGVFIREEDFTLYIPAVSTSVGAWVGEFPWGPVNSIETITSKGGLVRRFGNPTKDLWLDYYVAENFLRYTSDLRVVRVVGANANNSTSDSAGLRIDNREKYRENYLDGQGASQGPWVARYPGSLGESLQVSLCPAGNAFNALMVATASGNTGNAFVRFSGNTKADVNRPLQIGDFIRQSSNNRGGWVEVININSLGNVVTVNNANLLANTSGSTVVGKWKYADLFTGPPSTSDYAYDRGGANDEVHIVVVDRYGKFAKRSNTVLERYGFLSAGYDAKQDNGTTNYYRDVIEARSRYIYWLGHTFSGTNWGNTVNATVFTAVTKPYYGSLAGGTDDTANDSSKTYGYDLFADKDTVDISLIMTGNHSTTVKKYVLENIAMTRQDCVVFICPERTDVVFNDGFELNSLKEHRSVFPSTSYGFYIDNWKNQYDTYSDVYRWLPLDGDVAGLAARTDNDYDAWWSFAGFNRGQIKNVVKLAWKSNQSDRDELYQYGINSVIFVPNEGTFLYGDRTMLIKPSAFDRINVRRLFIVLEKAIAKAAKYSLFEFNDAFTRAQFVSLVEPYLRDVQGRRGIYDFRVVCDETNNTGEVIDRNEFHAQILIKPAKSINFIELTFSAVRTGVSFEEIARRG
jgi:hypothetical protein